jgi:hypothetical protein
MPRILTIQWPILQKLASTQNQSNLATISINFVPFLAILFVTFEFYRNLGPDHQVKKPWLSLIANMSHFQNNLELISRMHMSSHTDPGIAFVMGSKFGIVI